MRKISKNSVENSFSIAHKTLTTTNKYVCTLICFVSISTPIRMIFCWRLTIISFLLTRVDSKKNPNVSLNFFFNFKNSKSMYKLLTDFAF